MGDGGTATYEGRRGRRPGGNPANEEGGEFERGRREIKSHGRRIAAPDWEASTTVGTVYRTLSGPGCIVLQTIQILYYFILSIFLFLKNTTPVAIQ